MNEDDGLVLNLSSFNDGQQEGFQRKKGRGLKWKERKLQKRQSYLKLNVTQDSKNGLVLKKPSHASPQHKRESVSSFTKTKVQENIVNGNAPNEGVYPRNPGIKKPKEKLQVISSLFKYNPEIPKLKSPSGDKSPTKNKDQEEEVFSADKFSELKLSTFMVSNLENDLNLITMTSIQKAAIPSLLEGKDVFVKSKTGTGKTLTYAVPVINSIQNIKPKINRGDGMYAVILVPTRELAIQSFDVLQKLVKPFQWVVPGIVTGGANRKAEKARLRKGVNVLVATPGRLLDHIEKTKSLELKRLRWIVLDEADRLLDLGFEKDVCSILTAINTALFPGVRCQTVLLSATLTEGVQRLAGVSLHEPLFIDVTVTLDEKGTKLVADVQGELQVSNEASYSTPQQLKQFFIVVPSKLRLVTLAAFLLWKSKDKETSAAKMIVFLSSRDSVDFHCDLFKECILSFSESQLAFFKLHGNMSQQERTAVFKNFSQAKNGILLCTDVAARGLDLPHVNWIVQYNTPGNPADYVHRVGRTARIGLEGNALLFLTPAEVAYLQTLKQHGIRPEELLVEDVLKTLVVSPDNKARKKLKNDLDQSTQESATNLQKSFEEHVLSNEQHLIAAKTAYQSFVRAYATYPSHLKHIFHVKTLHLGHVAKSFALREAPKEMFQNTKVQKTKKRKRDGDMMKKSAKRKVITEHSSEPTMRGPMPKKRKKKKTQSK
ncbi:ATP-dependent DNA helicase DDX31-like isoform X2 [Montipora capricornis]|uniref:ATP-dependent DNA helicase DDX31-like isoform X2 n=1 Tax=Montipora capricornis TaxID=246305 RepID=UPI0035F18AA4